MGFQLSRFVYKSFLRVCFFQEGVSRGFVICSKGSVSSLPDIEETFTDPNIKTTYNGVLFPSPRDVFPHKAKRWQHKHQPAAVPFS